LNFIIKYILIIVIILSYTTKIEAQDSGFPAKVDYFELDVIGNLYFVNSTEVSKFNSSAIELNTYSNLMYGGIEYIDVRDAMNILVYYQNSNKILMLDNTLSIKNSPIDLSDLGYSETTVACLSYNNAFWIYDAIGHELLRFNLLLENTDRSGDLKSITGYNLNPVQIIERDNQLILRDEINGIFVFDRYGGYLRRIPFYDLDDFYIRSNTWQMLKNDTNYSFNPMTLFTDTVLTPLKNIDEMRVNSKTAYFKLKDKTFVYKSILK